MASLRVRSILITLNEPEKFEELKEFILSLDPDYAVAGKEIAPTTGHEHIHIYVQFGKQKRICPQDFLGAHVDICRGTPQQNEEYVTKDGEVIWRHGILNRHGGRRLPTIEEAEKMDLSELKSRVSFHYYSAVQKLEQAKKKEPSWSKVKVIWIYGPTGTGKTRVAIENGAVCVKYRNGFWSDWGDATKVCIEELRGEVPYPELLEFLDDYHNYYKVNIKGGWKFIDFEEIYITSPLRPEECYPKQAQKQDSISQLLRRIDELISTAPPADLGAQDALTDNGPIYAEDSQPGTEPDSPGVYSPEVTPL